MTVATEAQAAALEGYVEVTDEQAKDIGFLKAARKNVRGWETRRDELNAKVKALLDGATGAVHRGKVIAEVSERGGRRQIDWDLLASKYPDAYAECVSDGPKQRVLNLK